MLFAAAMSYAALFVLLLVQALNGVSLIAGEKTTSGLLVGWAFLSLLAVSICATWSTSPAEGRRTRTAARPA